MDIIFLVIISALLLIFIFALLNGIGRGKPSPTKYEDGIKEEEEEDRTHPTIGSLYTSEFSDDVTDFPVRERKDEDSLEQEIEKTKE